MYNLHTGNPKDVERVLLIITNFYALYTNTVLKLYCVHTSRKCIRLFFLFYLIPK